jgi:tetratricopeptide (TPR) repeat protein
VPVIDASVAANHDEGMDGSAALQLPPITPSFAPATHDGGRGLSAAAVERSEALVAAHRYEDALAVIGEVHITSTVAPDLALRTLLSEGWARMSLGQLDAADASFERARGLAERPDFSDADRAEALFRLGACRLTRGKVSNAVSLLTVALEVAERGGVAGDRLRARSFEWRARCYVLQREWEAAQVDAERALELAESIGDARLVALATMQCSVIAERRGDPRLALFYAERAREAAVETGDRRVEARLLNNIGGLHFLLGRPERAVACLKESFALSLERGDHLDAAQAVSSLAQVHLRCGAPQLAEEQARHALSILDGREDYADERGNVQLVLGRALLEQERRDEAMTQFAAAEWLFERHGSRSHLAAAWLAQADAYRAGDDLEAAVALYRRAAEALQDFNF